MLENILFESLSIDWQPVSELHFMTTDYLFLGLCYSIMIVCSFGQFVTIQCFYLLLKKNHSACIEGQVKDVYRKEKNIEPIGNLIRQSYYTYL